MAVTVKSLVEPKFAKAVQTTNYTAVNCRAIIDKFTITNTALSNHFIYVHIVQPSDPVIGDANKIISARTIAPGETYTCPELVGHALEPNGYISTLADADDALTIAASGREIT